MCNNRFVDEHEVRKHMGSNGHVRNKPNGHKFERWYFASCIGLDSHLELGWTRDSCIGLDL